MKTATGKKDWQVDREKRKRKDSQTSQVEGEEEGKTSFQRNGARAACALQATTTCRYRAKTRIEVEAFTAMTPWSTKLFPSVLFSLYHSSKLACAVDTRARGDSKVEEKKKKRGEQRRTEKK